jgi:rubrerythrin|tara:strand:+ start:469 stop:780 length:312 start_codon:yes stop_codon:yes gene_type:complete
MMDNTENNSWDEISNDVSEVKKKIKDKVVSENSIDDLKDSFQLTIENSKEILKNLIAAVDETVKDEEIRSETKEIIKKISNELTELIEDGKNKVGDLLNKEEE